MSKNPKESRREVRTLKNLVPFPLQSDFFDDLSEHDLVALADDIDRNGLRSPIEVLPTNKAGYSPDTLLSGHQRKRALERNGLTKAEVIVRYDLSDASSAEIETAFFDDNDNRRQLDKLAKAKVALRRYEIERHRPRGGLRRDAEKREARDRVGQAIGMSGRNLQRYFRVLFTPKEVQDAFRSNRLPLIAAEKVADLDAKQQQAVARRIASGEDPKAVVSDHLPKSDGRHRRATPAFISFIKALKRGIEDLDGRVPKVWHVAVRQHSSDLKRARTMIDELLQKVKK
jgi:ParB-like chromosome segregation protein Spo0J